MAKQTGTVLEEPAWTPAWESPSRHGDGNGRDRSLGNPKRWMLKILIMGNIKFNKNPAYQTSCFVRLFCSVFLASFCFCGEVFWPQALHRAPCLQSGNRQAQSKPDSFGSVLFSTSLITTFLPFGQSSSSPFPSVAQLPPGCRKEAIGGMFLRMMRECQQRRPSLLRFAAPWGPTRAAG